MYPALLPIFSLLVTVGFSLPSRPGVSSHVIHEKRGLLPSSWTAREKLDGEVRLPLRIGLKQQNLELGPQFLDEVSNPLSDKYAQHWTAQQVKDMFLPSEETVSSVTSWLVDSGVDEDRIKLTLSGTWVEVNTTVAEAEELLRAEYHIYDHPSGVSHIGCREYSLPSYLSSDHIDIILPSVHFDAKISPRKNEIVKRDLAARNSALHGSTEEPAALFVEHLREENTPFSTQDVQIDTTTCDSFIIPDCLNLLYNVSAGNLSSSSYGIVEYTPQSYLPADLDLFFANFSPSLVGKRPIFNSIAGGVLVTSQTGFEINGESDLDLEYAFALASPTPITLYQVGDLIQGASFNNFLDGIDASYCTFEGGDDPEFDGIYPSPFVGGYEFQDCGIYSPASVISTSYGYNEADLTPAYEARQCAEYMKLGLQGVTVLYSSGDSGVAGNGGQCLDPDGTFNNGDSGTFAPSFPGGCPYVTSVGATQVPTGVDVTAAIASGTQPEAACETVIFSGGGFSNVFDLPDYQKGAVSSYLADFPPPYGADRFNNSGTSRAFPDVSANGANYVIAVDGIFGLVYGTSASSPVFGSIIALINEQLLAAGKSPVGFINPVLYANPQVLTDVTNGTNPGCGTDGFAATPGWDPLTGLGTPNYDKMLELFLSLQ